MSASYLWRETMYVQKPVRTSVSTLNTRIFCPALEAD